ncbi:MAG: hypothetical protein M0017_12785 [Desulfobacteraceae bacterium]|nr:hypothetical protein [Desulfobacteraceae bacterium]
MADRKDPGFYPPVPGRLPDLNQGYVFNEARSLVDEKNGEAAAVADTTLDDATYVGSVISGKRRIGVVAYTEKSIGQQPQRFVIRGRPDMAGAQAGASQSKHIELAPGETFGGYTVAEVLPDRIVFKKNGRSMEKLLDVAKERKPPPTLPAGRRPQPQGGQERVVTPRQAGPAGRVQPVRGPEPGRPAAMIGPAALPQSIPRPQPMMPTPVPPPPMSSPPPPGTVIHGGSPVIIPGIPQVEQSGG